jgi:pyruvate formate lyase activating enzyme
MTKCRICGNTSFVISRVLSLCKKCILEDTKEAKDIIRQTHIKIRENYGLPPLPPEEGNVICSRCVNKCRIPAGEKGYCGMIMNIDGKLKNLSNKNTGFLSYYYDNIPTNCVASWICPANKESDKYGYNNLAVFYHSCTFNCLFCQNSHFRDMYLQGEVSSKSLTDKVKQKTYCICYFGGDPASQIEHSIMTSELALRIAEENGNQLRICWETNGSMSLDLLRRIIKITIKSGGIIKIDLKAISKNLHFALTGVSNSNTLKNIKILAEISLQHSEKELFVVSTLLIPGYIDEVEMKKIADFISNLNKNIPLSLLAFHPCYTMDDLPTTSKRHAEECLRIAKEAGLKRVNIANVHLLSDVDY